MRCYVECVARTLWGAVDGGVCFFLEETDRPSRSRWAGGRSRTAEPSSGRHTGREPGLLPLACNASSQRRTAARRPATTNPSATANPNLRRPDASRWVQMLGCGFERIRMFILVVRSLRRHLHPFYAPERIRDSTTFRGRDVCLASTRPVAGLR